MSLLHYWFICTPNSFVHFSSFNHWIIFASILILDFFPLVFFFLFHFCFLKQLYSFSFFLVFKILTFFLLLKYYFAHFFCDLYFPFLIFSLLHWVFVFIIFFPQLSIFSATQLFAQYLPRFFISISYHALFSNLKWHL
jgi:hypothetical protein